MAQHASHLLSQSRYIHVTKKQKPGVKPVTLGPEHLQDTEQLTFPDATHG